jgi:hypothetical protein
MFLLTGFARSAGRLALLGITLLLLLGAGAPASYSQTSAWSEPVMLSIPGQFSWFPDVAVDLTGRIHVVWSAGVTANRVAFDSVMHTSSEDGVTWTDVNDIFVVRQPNAGESAATRPTLFVDAYNNLHGIYTDYFKLFYSIAPAEGADSASVWSPAKLLGSGEPVYYSWMAADSQNRLHVVYTENVYTRSCPICYHVYYRQSDDGGEKWSEPVDVSRFATGAAKSQLLIDRQDNLHVVWEAGTGGSLGQLLGQAVARYAASYDGGVTWSLPVEFGSPITTTVLNESKSIVIGEDGREQLLIVWLASPEDRLYFQRSTDQGRSWTAPEIIPAIWGGQSVYPTRLDAYALKTDSAGNLHLIAAGRLEEKQRTLDLLHLVWDGATWSTPEPIVRLSGDVAEWPRLAVRGGNELHLVWFVRNKEAAFGSEASSARYAVWYARRQLDTPAIIATPLVRPTQPVTALPTVEDQPSATPTPRPTERPILTSPSNRVDAYGETDYLLYIGLSLTPVLGLIGLILLGIRLRQRP